MVDCAVVVGRSVCVSDLEIILQLYVNEKYSKTILPSSVYRIDLINLLLALYENCEDYNINSLNQTVSEGPTVLGRTQKK